MIKGAWIRKKTQIIWVLKNLHARKCDQLQFGNITLSFNKEGYRKVKVVVYPSNKYLLKFNNRNTGTTSTGNCFLGNNYFCTKAPFVSVIKTYLMMKSIKDVLENVSLKLLWYFQEIVFSETHSYCNTKKLTGHSPTGEFQYKCFHKIFSKHQENTSSRIPVDVFFHKSATIR